MAIKTQEGVKKILLSGLRATVLMEDGRELDKEKTTKALVAQGLGLASFEKQESAVPEAAYLLTVTGTG
ncbi:MAG: hypothetical protein H7A51_05360 [Akkermansiaceae bacterium]|nr:hypothetical protein [Akkermansiaceae bacterium]